MSDSAETKDWGREYALLRRRVRPWERRNLPPVPLRPNQDSFRAYQQKVRPFVERGQFWFDHCRFFEKPLMLLQFGGLILSVLSALCYVCLSVLSLMNVLVFPLQLLAGDPPADEIWRGWLLWGLSAAHATSVWRLVSNSRKITWLERILRAKLFSTDWYFGRNGDE